MPASTAATALMTMPKMPEPFAGDGFAVAAATEAPCPVDSDSGGVTVSSGDTVAFASGAEDASSADVISSVTGSMAWTGLSSLALLAEAAACSSACAMLALILFQTSLGGSTDETI